MSSQSEEGAGDFVRVATCATPTEAHLLKGVLESAGLAPRVADANIVQANAWMTQAVGGVRVLVPASQVDAALKTIEEFHAGEFQLPGEEVAATTYLELPSPVFSPDRAVLLSLLLTPVFGAAVQMANASALGNATRRTSQWVWLLLLAVMSAAGVAFMHRLNPGPLVVFRTSFVLSGLTIAWYFIAGQDQSRTFLANYGPRYKKKSLAKPSMIVAVVLLALGLSLSEFV